MLWRGRRVKKGDVVKLSPEGLRSFPRSSRGVTADARRGEVLNAGFDSNKPLAFECVRVRWNNCRTAETIWRGFVELAGVSNPSATPVQE